MVPKSTKIAITVILHLNNYERTATADFYMDTNNYNIITDNLDTKEFIHEVLEHHELVREAIAVGGVVRIYSVETKELFELSVQGTDIRVTGCICGAEPPTDPKDLILEEGFCHTVDFMEATRDIPIPDDLIEYNYIFAKRAERCGCCYCGAIFPGSEITDYIRDGKGDIAGTASCPRCGGMAVVAEEGDIKVNENNLRRWFLHIYDEYSMEGTHPQPKPRELF